LVNWFIGLLVYWFIGLLVESSHGRDAFFRGLNDTGLLVN